MMPYPLGFLQANSLQSTPRRSLIPETAMRDRSKRPVGSSNTSLVSRTDRPGGLDPLRRCVEERAARPVGVATCCGGSIAACVLA